MRLYYFGIREGIMKYAAPLLLAIVAVAGCHKHQAGIGRTVTEYHVSNKNTVSKNVISPKPYAENIHEDYHVIVFGYNKPQGSIRPSQTHTFVTWVRSKNKEIIEQVDISWLPKSDTNSLGEVQGRNRSLDESLTDAQGGKLNYWVLRTDRTFFEDAQKKRDSLNLYRFSDSKSRPQSVNSIHACSDIAGYLETGTLSGISASQKVADFYVSQKRAWAVPPKENDDWLLPLLLKTWNCTLP